MTSARIPIFLLCVSLAVSAGTGDAWSAPTAGCGRVLAGGTYTLKNQGVDRTYRLFVPARYKSDGPTPLIVVFHGWGGDENEFLGDPDVTAQSEARGYILVAPRGLGSDPPDHNRNSWSFRGSTVGQAPGGAICATDRTPDFTYPSCRNVALNSCSWTQCQADDVAFALALVHDVETKLCVDTHRVFAAGGSNGGMFAWELGQNAASATTFRAIAPLIGLPHRGFVDPPATTQGMPVLLITGTADPTVPPGSWESTAPTVTRDGSVYYYASATAMMRRWGAPNSCPYSGRAAAAFDAAAAPAECRTYCGQDARGWSGPKARKGWPRALDCRAPMGHEYGLSWSWRLVLDFFDAQS